MQNRKFSLNGLQEFVGQSLGVSDWVTVDQSRINQFAQCTGDDQWIHVNVERAPRDSPFGGPVAHGYLTLALLAPTAFEIFIAQLASHRPSTTASRGCASSARSGPALEFATGSACCQQKTRARDGSS
jgi:hypothetical protein